MAHHHCPYRETPCRTDPAQGNPALGRRQPHPPDGRVLCGDMGRHDRGRRLGSFRRCISRRLVAAKQDRFRRTRLRERRLNRQESEHGTCRHGNEREQAQTVADAGQVIGPGVDPVQIGVRRQPGGQGRIIGPIVEACDQRLAVLVVPETETEMRSRRPEACRSVPATHT
jgi:hypothetical protein